MLYFPEDVERMEYILNLYDNRPPLTEDQIQHKINEYDMAHPPPSKEETERKIQEQVRSIQEQMHERKLIIMKKLTDCNRARAIRLEELLNQNIVLIEEASDMDMQMSLIHARINLLRKQEELLYPDFERTKIGPEEVWG